MKYDEYLTRKEVRARLGCTIKQLREYIKSGKIKCLVFAERTYRFAPADVEEFKQQRSR